MDLIKRNQENQSHKIHKLNLTTMNNDQDVIEQVLIENEKLLKEIEEIRKEKQILQKKLEQLNLIN